MNIRVGGTSLDHSVYDPTQAAPVTFPSGEAVKNVPNNLHFGPSYFASWNLFSPVQYTLDIPLATANTANSIAFAKQAFKTIASPNSLLLEAGNEPNLYTGRERPNTYGPAAYVTEWASFSASIAQALNIPLTQPIWQVGTLATYKEILATPWSSPSRDSWSIQDLFTTGGLAAYLPRIKSVSMHYYQTISTSTFGLPTRSKSVYTQLQTDLMNHTALTTGLAPILSSVAFLAKSYPTIPLVLDEVGSALNPRAAKGTGTINNDGLEAVLGAALWTADLLLYCMANGVARVQMQQGIGFGFAAWLPTAYKGLPAAVRAPYYALLFAADFLGPSAAGGTTVVSLQLHGAGRSGSTTSDTLVAYGAYSGGRLQRVALLNMNYWASSPSSRSGSRGNQTFSVMLGQGLGTARSVEVWRLASTKGATAMAADITWAGSRWSAASAGLEQAGAVSDRSVIPVASDGSVQVTVRDSEAVLLRLRYS